MPTVVLEKHTAAGGSDVRRTSRGPRLARQIERSYFSVCVAHRKGGVGKTTTPGISAVNWHGRARMSYCATSIRNEA
jgi:hypothetical protein